MAYKPMEEILENIKDTMEVLEVIKPIYITLRHIEKSFYSSFFVAKK